MPAQSPTFVAEVGGDDRRVARVVLRDTGLDLADQVGTDIGALGEDTAAESGEDGDQRAAEAEADQCMQDLVLRRAHGRQNAVIAGDTEQRQTHHQQAGDGAAAEGNLQCGVEPVVGGLGGAHIGAHRDIHTDVAGGARQHRADDEAERGVPA
jgi:hypothetical protein